MGNIFIQRVEVVNHELLTAFGRLIPQLTRAPIPSLQDLQNLLDSSSVLVVARTDETGPIIGVGTLGVFRTPSGIHAHIEDVVVDESLRGRGIGQALVLYLLQIARQMGLKGVSLTCNPNRLAANRLYQKMGFKKWETNIFWYEL
jgi:ribosomal protein S18 acetylase RimI-like enzyme